MTDTVPHAFIGPLQDEFAALGLALLEMSDAEGPTISLEHSERLQERMKTLIENLTWLDYGP